MRRRNGFCFLTVLFVIFMVGCSSKYVLVNARFLECVECVSKDEELNHLWAFSMGGDERKYQNFPRSEGMLVCDFALRDEARCPLYEASELWLIEKGKRMAFRWACPGQRVDLIVLGNSVKWTEYFEGLSWNVVVKRRIWDAESGDPRMCMILEPNFPSCPEDLPVRLGL